MGFSKYTGVEKAEILSPRQHEVISDELRRMGKTSATDLSPDERETLEDAIETAE